MAMDLQAAASEKAELLSRRLRELLSAGQGFIRTQLGVDLGLDPESCPTWVLIGTAALGLLLLVLVPCWAALCGGPSAGKRRGSACGSEAEAPKAAPIKAERAEEQKRKKSRKKAAEKKAQSNGQPVSVPREEVSAPVSKPPPEIPAEKVEQPLVQVKKNKKKAKADVKPGQSTSPPEVKEMDEGAWETKVSNREKRQQRRKDRGPEDSGSPGGTQTPKSHTETPVTSTATNSKKNRDSVHTKNSAKCDVSSGSVSSSWREETTVNGSWTDVPLKLPAQAVALEGDKWSAVSTGSRHRTQPEAKPWGQNKQATWSGVEGRMNTDPNPVSFSLLRLNPAETMSHPINLHWDSHLDVDDEWSGLNGMDPSSDWNAPVEHWGNFEEASTLVTLAPSLKEQLGTHKISGGEKEAGDPSGVAKSKKKKKKKNVEEEAAPFPQAGSSVSKHPELRPPTPGEQSPRLPASQKKSEQIGEPPKPAQKKKTRREI